MIEWKGRALCSFLGTSSEPLSFEMITVSPLPVFFFKQLFPFPHLLSDLPITYVSGLNCHLCVCGMFIPLKLRLKLIIFYVVRKI